MRGLFLHITFFLLMVQGTTYGQIYIKLGFIKAGTVEFLTPYDFGGEIPGRSIISNMVVMQSNTAADEISGKVAFVETDWENAEIACINAQNAGAIAVVVSETQKKPDNITIVHSTGSVKLSIPCLATQKVTASDVKSFLRRSPIISISKHDYNRRLALNKPRPPMVDEGYAATYTYAPPTAPAVSTLIASTKPMMVVDEQPKIAPKVDKVENTVIAAIETPKTEKSEKPNMQEVVAAISQKKVEKTDNISTVTPQTSITSENKPNMYEVVANISNTALAPTMREPEIATSLPTDVNSVALMDMFAEVSDNEAEYYDKNYLSAMVEVFPLKVSDITIVSYEMEAKTPLSIRLVDKNGNILDTKTTIGDAVGMLDFDVTNYPSGKYAISISDGKTEHKQNITIEH